MHGPRIIDYMCRLTDMATVLFQLVDKSGRTFQRFAKVESDEYNEAYFDADFLDAADINSSKNIEKMCWELLPIVKKKFA